MTATPEPAARFAPNPLQPPLTDDPHLPALAQDLVRRGQLNPIEVVPAHVFLRHWPELADVIGNAAWVVLRGNRRVAAARLAGVDITDKVILDDVPPEYRRPGVNPVTTRGPEVS